MILIPLVTLLLSQGSEWSIEHNTTEQGPTTIHDGLVRLQITEEDPYPCMSTVLVVGKGVLSGPPTSSSPGKPLIPFDKCAGWLHHGRLHKSVRCFLLPRLEGSTST